ncbi:unnamed protein product [Clavelina lepadiformis]|uniref:PAX-interacting protein 1 n=2 Tax=Clavelina lepadiformis TaxID=159417 RepID=A0ABP0FYQ2_CLALP
MEEDKRIEEELFKDVRYYVVGKIDEQTKQLLTKGKAKAESYLSALATHVIVTDPAHYEAEAAREVWQIPTVKPSWVELSVLCKTMLPTDAFSTAGRLFAGKTFSLSQLSLKDKTLLWSVITYYGGCCQTQLNRNCTHLVVAEPKGPKYDEAEKEGSKLTIVAPDWIMESIKQKALQPPDTYHPKLNIVPQASKVADLGKKISALGKPPNVEQLSISDSSSTSTNSKPKHVQSEEIVTTKSMDFGSNLGEVPIQTQHQLSAAGHASLQPGTIGQTQQMFPPGEQMQSVPSNAMAAVPFTSPNTIHTQQVRYGSAHNQGNRALPPQATVGPQRFSVPNVPMRSPVMPPYSMMSSNQQSFSMMSSNQQSPMGIMSPGQQQSAMASPGSPYMVTSPRANTTSPRRSSQSSSKKKKSGAGSSQGNRPPHSPHSTVRQVHPMSQFSPNNSAMFSSPQQQQMMMKPRHPTGMEQPAIMQMNPGVKMPPSPGGPRMAGVHSRFPNPSMGPQQPDNFQHMQQQQQLMQLQQQQQMQRMGMMRQNTPMQGQVPQVDPMQQKWPRTSMDPGYSIEHHQGQQMYSPHAQQSPNNSNTPGQIMRPPGQILPPQQTPPHAMQMGGSPNISSGQQPHYSQMMMNRFPGQMNPQQQQQHQQQQMMFQQMSQQQQRSPGVSRFPTSTSLEAAGISGISPIALQQGLLNASQRQMDHPTLIHPSLQGAHFPKVPTSQSAGAVTQKKRTKTRKKTVEGTEEEPKGRGKPRGSKAKKNPAPTPPMTPTSMTGPMTPMQISPNIVPQPQGQYPPQGMMMSHSMPGHVGMVHVPHPSLPQPIQITSMTPPAIPPGPPFVLSSASQVAPTTGTIAPLASTPSLQAVITTTSIPSSNQTFLTPSVDKKVLATKLKPTIVPEIENSGGNIPDPLKYTLKELDTNYTVRDPSESVPQDLFLLGCIFYIFEYEEILNDASAIDLWKKMIEKFGGIVEEKYSTICTHLICVTCTTAMFRQGTADGKRFGTVYWLNDVLHLRTLRVPWLPHHLPTQFSHKSKPAANQTLSYTGFRAKEREVIKIMGFICGAKLTGFLGRTHTGLLCKSANGLKHTKASAWMIPCISIRWLCDLIQHEDANMIDMKLTKYQKLDNTKTGFLLDTTRTHGLLEAWKIPISITQDCIKRAHVKRKLDPVPIGPSLPKRSKTCDTYESLPRVCFTGLSSIIVEELIKKLDILQGNVETNYTRCTHLVSRGVSRTVKFLSCISSCSYVVTPEWIDESFKNKWLLDEGKYLLVDKSAENKFKFSLQETIKRARKAPLFRDCLFCITKRVEPDRKTLKQVVECAGGRVLNKMPQVSVLKQLKAKSAPNNRVFVVSCPDDETLYKTIKKEGLQVHNAEIILTGVLKQEIDTESFRL